MAKWFIARNFLAGLILLVAVSLSVYVADQLLMAPVEQMVDLIRPEADLAMQTIHYTETRDGERIWSLQADSAAHDLETGRARVENIRMTVFDSRNGDIGITARTGHLDLQQRQVQLTGNVEVKTTLGQILKAEDLLFVDAERTVRTEGLVAVVAPDYQVSGVGLIYQIDTRRMQLLKQVDAKFFGRIAVP
jgi:LPS export ABC transporter protein LptC